MNDSSRRSILAIALALCTLAGGAAVEAATPPSGTISEASPLVTWTGSPQPPTASAECGGPDNPACDNFQLNIVAPASSFAVEILVTPTGGDDYDLEVYDPAGEKIGGSGNNPGQPETVSLLNPASGTYTVSVANFAAALPYNAQAEMTPQDPPPPPGDPSEGPSFAIYTAPGGLGTNSGEPSVGVNWNTDKVMYIAGLETLQIDFQGCTSPAQDSWTDVSFTTTSAITLDPILFTDPITGRTFASQLSAKCSSMAFTDDDGGEWTPSQGCGINAGVDHQSVGGGPFAPPLTRDPEGPLYPHAVYYCSQDVAIAQCARSDTGGLTFNEATPIYNITECGGLHGHVKVADNDGTVYVPNKGCNGEQAVAVSEDNGVLGSWSVRRVPGTTSGEWDPSVGIGSDGTLYLGMTNGGRPMVAVSFDKGLSWSSPVDVGIGAGPTGQDILNTAFPVVVAGDGDRAAFGFLGAEQGGDGGGQNANSGHLWFPYVAITYDAGASWTTVNLTPDDPVQRGTICSSGTTCESTRNLLDFNDMSIDAEGRVVFAYADGCIGGCVKQGPNSASELATLARQKSGKRMFAEFDAEDVPAAPASEVRRIAADTAELSWEEPFDGGSPITGYNIYRRADFETELSFLASAAAGDRSYVDGTLGGFDYCYQVLAVNAFGEGFACGEVCTGGPVEPEESPCQLPGLTVAEDPLGDTNPILDPADDPSLDLERVSMAEPFTTDGSQKLVVTMKVEELALPHPSANWRTFWTSPDGQQYFVALQSCNAANGITCSYGTFDGTIFSSQGAPEGCLFDDDGTIQITVDKGLVGIDDGSDIGNSLAGVEGRTQVVVGALCSGLLGTADSAAGGNYQIFGNATCGDVGEPPIARDDSAATIENAAVVVDVLANDTSFNGSLTVVGFSDPAFGAVTNNGNGTLTYQPDPGFSSPPDDSFTYTVQDAAGLSDSATVTVTVTPACAPTPTGSFDDDFEPAAEDGWLVDTPVNTLGPLSPAWAVATDSGAKSPTRSFFSDATTLEEKDDRLLAPPQNLSESSELTFWHRFEFESTYDGGVLEVSTDGGSTWLDVVDAGGVFLAGGYNALIDSGFNSAIAGRPAWSGGSADDPMSLVRVDLAALAGFDVRLRWRLVADPFAPGAVPGAGWWIDDVGFSATLEAGTCNPPIAVPDSASTPINTPVVIEVLANDSDPDGDPLTLAGVTQPANGTVTDNGDNTVTYHPNLDFVGSDTFTYSVCDDGGLCDSAQVTVSVFDGNEPPVANDDSAVTPENTAVEIDVLANDSDPDGHTLSVASVTQGANGSAVINPDQTVTYTPDPGFVGNDSFTYVADDGHGATDQATVTVTVTEGPNGMPQAADDAATTSQDTAVVIDVLANDSDPDGDPLSVGSVSDPANGSATDNGDGTVTYQPDAGFTGTDSFTYQACDPGMLCDEATVTVSVIESGGGSGKVTGGGWIPSNAAGGRANFGFNAKQKGDGADGRLTYHCNDGGPCAKGRVDSLRASESEATFSGSCTLGGSTPCTFTAVVEDNGEPGTADRFSIEIFDLTGALLHQADELLGGGNIQIH